MEAASKSFSMGHLAQLLSWMPGWISRTIRDPEIDLMGGAGYSLEKTESLLAVFDKNVRDAHDAIAAAKEKDFGVSWSLKRGEQVLMTLPKGAAVRQHINHLVHHRGQLSVYLRLVEVPLPSIYGPTADERS